MNDPDMPLVKQVLSTGDLRGLVEQALKLEKANEALQTVLQEPFKGQVSVGQIHQGCLTLDVPNASMHTLLRYQTSDILRQIRQVQGLSGIASIKCRVKIKEPPFHVQAPGEMEPPRPLSDETRTLLKNTAEHISDPDLAAILLRLSER